jgi:voltage-gated potassium channel Kch
VPRSKAVNFFESLSLTVSTKSAQANVAEADYCASQPWLRVCEAVCVYWFTFELVLRFLIHPNKCAFVREVLNVIDFLAIAPFYIERVEAFDFPNQSPLTDFHALTLKSPPPPSQPIRNTRPQILFAAGVRADSFDLVGQLLLTLRTLRVLRILKLARYSTGLQKFGRVLIRSRAQLLTAGMSGVIGIMVLSTMVYYAEKDMPNSKFINIPTALYWGLVTMASVGYGDIVPETTSLVQN